MREIKFRIKYLADDVTSSPPSWLYLYFPDQFKSEELYLIESSYDWDTFSQYTGIKDKNGKEIYEGDILRAEYPAGYSLCEVRFGLYDNVEPYEDHAYGNGFYYIENRFYHSGREKEIKKDIYPLVDSCILGYPLEVVGNIYENPELLGES